MILNHLSELNWLAVLVAAIAWFAFSAAWYSVPPLSKAWQAAARVDPSGAGSAPMVTIMVITLVAYFVTATVIALIAAGIGASTVADGIALGVTLGVGFGLAGYLVTQLYETKGSTYWLINGINAVISFSIVGTIVSVWQ